MKNFSYSPPFFIKNKYIQTALASHRLEKLKNSEMFFSSKEMLIDSGENVKLQGFYSPQKENNRGLVLLLHGWEGDVNSSYMLRTGNLLYQNGYEIFRLNFRDHGDTHHLNVELFNGSLLPEIFSAALKISELAKENSFYIAGFSMGGNFALRIARNNNEKISNLKSVVAISPAINPKLSTQMMDENSFLRKYFLHAWVNSLFKKEKHFPEMYDFKPYLDSKSVMELTERIVPAFSKYGNVDEYFNTYTLTGDYFKDLKTNCIIVNSIDDPVIDRNDFDELVINDNLNLFMTEHGGHCGFFEDYKLNTFYSHLMLEAFR